MQDRPQQLQMFTLCLKQYVYSAEAKTFACVPAMPAHLPAQICGAVDALRLIASGMLKQKGCWLYCRRVAVCSYTSCTEDGARVCLFIKICSAQHHTSILAALQLLLLLQILAR